MNKTISKQKYFPRLISTALAFLMVVATLAHHPVRATNETMATDTMGHDAGQQEAQNVQPARLAIEGYDPVAYFTELRAVRGMEEFSHDWLGDQWLFSSEENRQLFLGDAMAYMPNYGGYCSFDPVSAGHDHKIDPTAWRIVNDKLYLFYSEQTAGQKMHADEWRKVKSGLAQQ